MLSLEVLELQIKALTKINRQQEKRVKILEEKVEALMEIEKEARQQRSNNAEDERIAAGGW